jgi:hypothetical protein
MQRTPVASLDRATAVAEARVPGKLLQNPLEPGAAPLDRRQLRTRRLLRPQDQYRAPLRRRNPRASQHIDPHLKAAFPVAKRDGLTARRHIATHEDEMDCCAFLVVSAMAPCLLYKAEDGSVTVEIKKTAQHASEKSQKIHSKRWTRFALAHYDAQAAVAIFIASTQIAYLGGPEPRETNRR